jgi:FKBP12-rapamycin complex-associated protein
MQKVEVFTEASRKTTGRGNDLYEILWLKSTNSEEWLERRTRYTRSLAVMSIVGYILGLGDRHPSNLMIDKVSGRVLHIDVRAKYGQVAVLLFLCKMLSLT